MEDKKRLIPKFHEVSNDYPIITNFVLPTEEENQEWVNRSMDALLAFLERHDFVRR